MSRLNNNERNQAIVMLNAGMSANVVSQHFSCTRKSIERLLRQFSFTGNVAEGPPSGRSCVATAADDRYIVLQHLLNKCLTAAVWYSSTDSQKSVETKRLTHLCQTSLNGKAGLVLPSPALPTC